MYKQLLFILTIFISITVFSQVSPNKYWVKFTDKNDSPYSIDYPEEFLSQRALDRRANQNISIEENDLPVNPQYIDAVEEIGVEVLNNSKWFNSLIVYTTEPGLIDEIENLSFVQSVEKLSTEIHNENSVDKTLFVPELDSKNFKNHLLKSTSSFNYGNAFFQIDQINGIPLHEAGFDGTGMVIAVLDGGFTNADNLSCFDSLWMNNRILGSRDFVDPGNTVFDHNTHGTKVLSTMGAWLPGEMVGTAPMASYWLFRSEDTDSEYLVEELNWASAAEVADSVGADVINSSLSYSVFDDPTQDHTYSDMDGNTTPITIAADILASKGVLVVNSAGNYGNDLWYYIAAPADGNEVCAVGAVTSEGTAVGFSSHGPTYDGRIKPDVMALGSYSTVIDAYDGTATTGSGTSFSSPITAGMMACLWQSSPMKTNMEILEAARMSANFYNNPNESMGYGIPDYAEAMDMLTGINQELIATDGSYVYPNPFNDRLIYVSDDTSTIIETITIYDFQGRIVYKENINKKIPPFGKWIIKNQNSLIPGSYILEVITNNEAHQKRIIKQ